MTKKYDGKDMVACFIITFLIALCTGGILGCMGVGCGGSDYDEDCLDRLANEICIEEGYAGGQVDSVWGKTAKNDIGCYLHKRGQDIIMLDWLEGEKETCDVCYNSTSERCMKWQMKKNQ